MTRKGFVLIAASVGVIAVAAVALLIRPGHSAAGRIFYVDAVSGSDDNSGTRPGKAWKTLEKVNRQKDFQPGDQILLRSGQTFQGPLILGFDATEGGISNCKGGTDGKPVIISRYGDGEDPLVEGSGENPNLAAVEVRNIGGVEITALKVKNNADNARRGIYLTADADAFPGTTREQPAVLQHVVVKNCEVSDISGRPVGMSSPAKCWGGIIAKITASKKSTGWVRYDDLLIQGNNLHDLSRCGLYTHTDFNDDPPYTSGGGEGTRPRLGWTRVVVKHNRVADVAGDGLVLTTCDSPKMEYNLVIRPQRYLASDLYAVGIWPFGCNDALVQYNEVCGNQSANDGMGFDIDFGNRRAVLQYNYSHDNEGGFVLVCAGPGRNSDATVRYNISRNDGGIPGSRIFEISGSGTTGCKVYNNTVITAPGPDLTMLWSAGVWQGTPQDILFANNLYINRSPSPLTNDMFDVEKTVMKNNFFDGVDSPSGALGSKMGKALLKNADAQPEGQWKNGVFTPADLSVFGLQAGSPAAGAGVLMEDNGGRDYFGTTLKNPPSIGAVEVIP